MHIRQAARQGIRLKLEPTVRDVRVSVVHKGKPVRDCSVRAATGTGSLPAVQTNEKGVAVLRLLESDQLSQVTAWTEPEHARLGGFSFHRDPPRNRLASEFEIELQDARRQRLRLVNEEDQEPVANCNFEFVIGMGPPHYQFPGRTPDAFLVTDAKGEAICRWFLPQAKGSYLELDQLNWYRATRLPELRGEVLVQVVRPSKRRRRVVGTVQDKDGKPIRGVYVEAWSFEGLEKNRGDTLFGFTDNSGRFFLDYLDGSEYSIYVNDSVLVSPRQQTVVYDPGTQTKTRPSLVVETGVPITVRVTSGANKDPVPYQWVNLAREEDGAPRRWGVITNKDGVASTRILAGSRIRASVHTPFWTESRKLSHKQGEAAELAIHHDPSKKKEGD